MTNAITLSEDEFNARFTLRPNHLNPHAAWDGNLFETYGPELDFIASQDAKTVWTVVDGDDGSLVLLSGFHLVNRIGYLITTVPVAGGTIVECTFSNDSF